MPEMPQIQPVKLQDASGKSLAVRSLRADVTVDGPMARTTLRITFNNDTDKVVEGDLVFPLPAFGALRDLEVKVGGREIKGQFKPRERAQAEYKKAVSAGHTAVLGESEGEDVARLRVAPIDKAEDVEVTVVIEHTIQPVTEGHRLIIPTTYMPRYVEDQVKLKPTELAAVDRPRPMTLAARATVKVAIRGDLDTQCLSHQATIAKTRCDDDGSTEVLVDQVALDRDVVIEIKDRPEGQNPKVWVRYDPSQGPDGKGPTTAVAVIAPRFADEGATIPREVVFLVDRSGSMSGRPIAAAIRAVKGCLRALNPQDRFNIVAFDDTQSALANASLPFDDKSLAAGDAFADGIRVNGGTRASEALQVVLQNKQVADVQIKDAPRPSIEHTLRVVVFITDGAVSGAEGVIKAAHADMHDTRMYVVGVGDSVNHAMLASLAEAGRGTYTPIGADEAIEEAISGIKSAIDAPLLTGVKVRVDDGDQVRDVAQVEAVGALDLFAGRPLLFAFRGEVKPGTTLILAGQRPGGADYKVFVLIDVGGNSSPLAATAWALLKNRRLTYRFDPTDNATLEELGTSYGVVNSQVALVGVHADPRNLTGDPETIPVVLPMPRNIAEQNQGSLESMTRGVGLLGGQTRGMVATRGMSMGAPGVYAASSQAKGMAMYSAVPSSRRTLGGGGDEDGYLSADLSRSRGDISAKISGDISAIIKPDPDTLFRGLMLRQGADGLFGGSYALTAVILGALAMHGHTARAGSFRAEVRRAAQALRSSLSGRSGDDHTLASLILAVLQRLDGGTSVSLPQNLSAYLAQVADGDPQATRQAIRGAFAEVHGLLAGSVEAQALYQSLIAA